jgi:hypothetical protein
VNSVALLAGRGWRRSTLLARPDNKGSAQKDGGLAPCNVSHEAQARRNRFEYAQRVQRQPIEAARRFSFS